MRTAVPLANIPTMNTYLFDRMPITNNYIFFEFINKNYHLICYPPV